MSTLPVLQISDGVTTISLISPTRVGIGLKQWTPSVAASKEGGIWADSPLVDGRQMVYRKIGNAIETFTLVVGTGSQDTTIELMSRLISMLETAVAFWVSGSRMSSPVWIEARGPNETNSRYAAIYDYKIPELSNPYATPFFAACEMVTMDEITLVIERGQWQEAPLGSDVCAQYLAQQADAPFYIEKFVSLGTDDGWIDTFSATIDLTSGAVDVGYASPTQKYRAGFRFQTIPISPGDIIRSATLVLYGHWKPKWYGETKLRVLGFDQDDAATFSTYADFIGRPLTSAFRDYSIAPPGEIVEGKKYSFNVTKALQEIVDRAGWAVNNDVAFCIQSSPAATAPDSMYFKTFETTYYPALLIEYYSDVGLTEPSCDGGFLSNQYSSCPITHVLKYDASVPSYTNITRTIPVEILPEPAANGDILYIGSDLSTVYGLDPPFSNVIFNFEAQFGGTSDVPGLWEYYQGPPTSNWVALEVVNATGSNKRPNTRAEDFRADGVCGVFFKQPVDTAAGDWQATTVNGINARWIRFRVTGAAAVIARQVDRFIYTCGWPDLKIRGSQVGGEMPARARLWVHPISGYHTGSTHLNEEHTFNRLFVATYPYIDTIEESNEYWNTGFRDERSKFQPYLPANDIMIPTGYSDNVVVGTNTVFVGYTAATAGYCAQYTPTATPEATQIRVRWYPEVRVYRGSFRILARVSEVGSTAGNFFVKAMVQSSGYWQVTPEAQTKILATSAEPMWHLLDLGTLQFPPFSDALSKDDILEAYWWDLSLWVRATAHGGSPAKSLYINDLILWPLDSFAGIFTEPSTTSMLQHGMWDNVIEIDSVRSIYQPLRSLGRSYADDEIMTVWDDVANGPFVLSNNRINKVFVHGALYHQASQAWISYPSATYSVKISKATRYFGMRGRL